MKTEISTSPVYSMGVAERLTGLTARQIRYWEQNGLITPARTEGRQRMYSEADILRLKEIKRLMVDGMTLDRVKAHYARKEQQGRQLTAAEAPRVSMHERIPRVQSLYAGSNRAELERMIGRNTGK
ncbi:MAG: MerR family transcriptional regulator [Mycobacterium leprae]